MLEVRPAQYAVVARMTTSLKRALGGLRYERITPRWEIAEFEHRAYDWPEARRCVVARRLIEETEPEPTLFTLERYLYRAWFTNLPLTPAGVWHFYDGRAGMEPRIREIREDYALSKIPTRAFEANALYLEVVRLAYNLVTAFQRTCLPEEWQSLTLSKLRHRLFWLPRELTRPQNRPTLRLVNSPLIAKTGEKILHRVHKLPCLAETMGRFRFRKPAQRVIKRDFHGIVGAKSIGTSGYHTKFVVEALDGTVGYLSFGTKPIQQ